MATQKRTTRGTSKKTSRTTSARATPKAAVSRRKRSASTVATRTERKGGVLKRAIKKGISESAKVGS